jgi:hypothetical protein
MQHGYTAGRRDFADRIQEWIVRSTARGELDADHASIEAALKLGCGVRTEVRVDDAVAADAIGVRALEGEETVVAVLDVGG